MWLEGNKTASLTNRSLSVSAFEPLNRCRHIAETLPIIVCIQSINPYNRCLISVAITCQTQLAWFYLKLVRIPTRTIDKTYLECKNSQNLNVLRLRNIQLCLLLPNSLFLFCISSQFLSSYHENRMLSTCSLMK